MISIRVQKSGTEEEPPIVGEVIASKLIQNKPQAIRLGIQTLLPLGYSSREVSISAPYENIKDGDIVSIRISNPEITQKFHVKSVEIRGNHKEGIWTTVKMRRFNE